MAFLKIIKGEGAGRTIELRGPRNVLGRHPACEVVLDNAAVSRQHAQVLESHGTFYLEDLRSRNRTFLNQHPVEGRTELRDKDELKVCDNVLRFYLKAPPLEDSSSGKFKKPAPKQPQTHDENGDIVDSEAEVEAGTLDRETGKGGTDPSIHSVVNSVPGVVVENTTPKGPDKSSIISTLDVRSTSNLRLGVKPEAKLRAVLNISKAVAHVLNVNDVLQKVLDGLFQIFPQADEGFVILRDVERQKLSIKVAKSRSADAEPTVRFSLTIVKHAMKTGEAILSADALEDSRFEMSESLSGLMIRSMMCVPLMGKNGEALGVIQIDTKDIRSQFSHDDLDLLVSVASVASLAVENARLHQELVKNIDAQKDLDYAMQIQLGFLPSQPPKIEGLEFSHYYEAALRVGGDYFDYIVLPGNRVAVAVGDVAGKGVPAALLMARLYSAARYHLLTNATAGDALTGLNTELASSGLGHRFITCILVVVDPKEGTLTIANAGHFPPLIRSADGNVEFVGRQESGLPLGIMPNQKFGQLEVPFRAGDALVLFTDGITDSTNAGPPPDNIYGRPRLQKCIAAGPADAEGIVQGIIDDIDGFCAGHPQRDDICLVCVRRRYDSDPPAEAPRPAGDKRRGRRKDEPSK